MSPFHAPWLAGRSVAPLAAPASAKERGPPWPIGLARDGNSPPAASTQVACGRTRREVPGPGRGFGGWLTRPAIALGGTIDTRGCRPDISGSSERQIQEFCRSYGDRLALRDVKAVQLQPFAALCQHTFEQPRRQKSIIISVRARHLAQIVPGHTKRFASSTITHDRSASRPRCSLTFAGISTAHFKSFGA
jgi:hypothetical protein